MKSLVTLETDGQRQQSHGQNRIAADEGNDYQTDSRSCVSWIHWIISFIYPSIDTIIVIIIP